VLYYPTIEFLDEVWLKCALCVWEKVLRIVPPNYVPKDSDEVKRAVDQGLVKNVALSPDDLNEAAESFEAFWEQTPITPAGIEGWEAIDVTLHPEKVDARIRPLLASLATKIDPDGRLSLSAEVANAYMLFLAESISRRRRIPKLTDNADMFAIMHYFMTDGNIDEWVYNPDAKEATTALVLEMVLPGGLNTMSIDRVLEVRRKTQEGRRAFRRAVNDFTEELKDVQDKDYAKELTKRFRERTLQANNTTLQSIGQTGRDAGYAVLSVGVPTTLTSIGMFVGLGNEFGLTAFGQGLMIGAVAALADALRGRRKAWTPAEALYYMQLDHVFKSEEGLRFSVACYDRLMEEFIND
jgi:hypothetical protein